MVSHCLYMYFAYVMYWYGYVCIHFYVGSWNQLHFYKAEDKELRVNCPFCVNK